MSVVKEQVTMCHSRYKSPQRVALILLAQSACRRQNPGRNAMISVHARSSGVRTFPKENALQQSKRILHFPNRPSTKEIQMQRSSYRAPFITTVPVTRRIAYFITFCTYGSHLQGDPRGSYSRKKEIGYIPPNPPLANYQSNLLVNPPVTLDWLTRAKFFDEIIRFGYEIGVVIDALNVRKEHLHLVAFPIRKITREEFIYSLKKRLSEQARKIPSLANNAKLWSRHYCVATLQTYSEWYYRFRYTLFGQGKNRYLCNTEFAQYKQIVFQPDGEPTPTSLSRAFMTARVKSLRENAFQDGIDNDKRVEIVECDYDL